MKTNQINTIGNIEPTVKVLPLQAKTEMVLARLHADYEVERFAIRQKINEESAAREALQMEIEKHKARIRELMSQEDALRVKYMTEKARVMEEAEYNRKE